MRTTTRTPLSFASLALIGALLCSAPAPAAGLKIGDDETYMKIALLLQGWAVFTEDGAPGAQYWNTADSWDTDFYLRRMRILLFGQLTDKVQFFVETDNPNFGKGGDFTMNTFIQDAWMEFNLHKAFQLDAGMLLVPFSHHGMQGAVTLHSLDYHAGLIKYPGGSNKVWRDFGVMARGLVSDHFEYRLGVFNGAHGGKNDPRNPHDFPRVTARLTGNVFDTESGPGTGGFFWDGVYLKKTDAGVVSTKKIVSFGVSADWQKDLNVFRRSTTGLDGDGNLDIATFEVAERDDYLAFAADAFWDLPLSDDKLLGLAGQVNFYYYDHGNRRAQADGHSRSFYGMKGTGEYSGYGIMSELGLRYDAYEALISVDWFSATKTDGDEGDLLSVLGGFNWWWLGHSTSVKVQLGGVKKNGGDFGFQGIVQTQLLF